MNERSRGEEHLRVIRSLMERATIYRAISAPTALLGGLLALATSGTIWMIDRGQAASGGRGAAQAPGARKAGAQREARAEDQTEVKARSW